MHSDDLSLVQCLKLLTLANSLDCGIKECFEAPLAMSCIEILIEYMTAGHESELVERGNFVFLEINEGVNLSVL